MWLEARRGEVQCVAMSPSAKSLRTSGSRTTDPRAKDVEQTSDATYWTLIGSPVGPLLAVERGGAVRGLYFVDEEEPSIPDGWVRDDRRFDPVASQLAEYFSGRRTRFDLTLGAEGTPFQEAVWSALQDIPYGTTASYRDIAETVGRPTATRAVGGANGRNPISIIVPCHRVIGADGSLTGFGGGLDRKMVLLELERSALERSTTEQESTHLRRHAPRSSSALS